MRMTNNYFEYVFISTKSLLVIRGYIFAQRYFRAGRKLQSYRVKNPFTSTKMRINYDKHKPSVT